MKIELNGYNIDELIKTLHLKKITITNIELIAKNKVSFEIKDNDYKKVNRYIANFKIKKSLSKFKQFPKVILNNIGVVLGCFFGVLFGFYVSNYTWQIEVYGTKDLSQKDIISVLSENGIKKGKINRQTSEEIEEILLNRYDRIAQVSVIREGTAIIINLSEKLVYVENEFEPIKAKFSGVIKEINLITGTINVKIGDYVNVGDILVLPFNINANGEKVSVEPVAEIKAEIYVVSKSEMNKKEIRLVRTGKTNVTYNYKLKNKKLFSSKNRNSFALFETVMYNENISNIIPLNRDVCVHYELIEIEVDNDFVEQKQNLIEQSVDLAYKNLQVGKILNEKTDTHIIGDTMYAITTLTVFGIIS